ncbi:acid beta-fructofuranosidase-like [Camellia sinensis]|uniref:acid beta-fructofuranosidase-like n=1 Tax=Camellia sinensis TaxID=4442 RepID=UPI0010358826|nr:acid beta-fructofuranosidase-like [Camellia sinensis]
MEMFSYSTAGGAANQGALGPFGLLVLADESLSEQTPIYFYVAKGAEGKLKTFFCADESRSSKATDVMKPIYRSTVPVLKGEKFSMRILSIAALKRGAYLLKYGRRGKPKFCPFRLSTLR